METARIAAVDPAEAQGRQKELMETVRARLGGVPNLVATLAQAPAALEAYLAQSDALARGVLDARLREQLAVAVAGANACDYCASAHSALGRDAGVSETEIGENLRARSSDATTGVALDFASRLVRQRGRVSDAELRRLRDAGFTTEQIVEIVAHVGLNLFTNYFNHVARTEIDFPVVPTRSAGDAAA